MTILAVAPDSVRTVFAGLSAALPLAADALEPAKTQVCRDKTPRVGVGNPGVSGGILVDNAPFRTWA